MGFFSWLTSDTKRSISNTYSSAGAFDVYMILPNLTEEEVNNAAGYGYAEIDTGRELTRPDGVTGKIADIVRQRHVPVLLGTDPYGIGKSGCLVTLEKAYDGYGVFGGVCFYAALFELNKSRYGKDELAQIKTYEDRRNEGIKIEGSARRKEEDGGMDEGLRVMKSEGWIFPVLVEDTKTVSDLGIGEIKWQDLDFCDRCFHQGYFY